MEQLAVFVKYEVWLLLGLLALIVAHGLLAGPINTAGLLLDKSEKNEISPVRVQLLAFTLVGAGSYLALTLDAIDAGKTALPEVPQELLLLVGGSHAIYLGGKSYLKFFRGALGTGKP